MAQFDISADSIPVYGYLWGYWSAADWITWFKANLQQYGQPEAVRKFIQYWNAGGKYNSYVAWRDTNADIRALGTEYGFLDQLQGNLIGGILGTAQSPITATTQAVSSTANALDSVAKLLPWVIVGVVVVLLVIVYKNWKSILSSIKR